MKASPEWLDAQLAKRQSWPKGGALTIAAGACADNSVSAPDGTIDALQLVPCEPPARRKSQPPVPLERDVQAAGIKLMQLHPKVAFVRRMNVGKFKVVDHHGERWIRAAFKGCSDAIGMLRDGRFLACEFKRPGEQPTPEQAAFLAHVKRHGGIAFVASSLDDVTNALKVA